MISETSKAKNISVTTTKTKSRTEIHIETREAFVIRSLNQTCIAWCEACGIEVRVLTPDAAAVVAATTPKEVYRRIECGLLHSVDAGKGNTLVCCNLSIPQ